MRRRGFGLPNKRIKMVRVFPPMKENRELFIFGPECRPSLRAEFAPWSVARKFFDWKSDK